MKARANRPDLSCIAAPAAPASRLFVVLLAALFALLAPQSSRADIDADSADDICAAVTDPCVVTDLVHVIGNPTLDFGTRALQITGRGQIAFSNTDAVLAAGSILLDTAGSRPAITARRTINGPYPGSESGNPVIEARRRCDSDLSITCLEDLTCAALSAGTCTVGDGSITINGGPTRLGVDSSAVVVGTLQFRSAGDIVLTSRLLANAKGNATGYGYFLAQPGGGLTLHSYGGSVRINGRLRANASQGVGYYGTGGDVQIIAGQDVVVTGVIAARGRRVYDNYNIYQYNDAGLVQMESGRDIIIDGTINVSSLGAGGGGAISMFADRDVRVGTTTRLARLIANGNKGIFDHFEGDFPIAGPGGNIFVEADGAVTFGRRSAVSARGSVPPTSGGKLRIGAGGPVSLDGKVVLNAGRGGEDQFREAGRVDIDTSSTVTFGSRARIELKGDRFTETGSFTVRAGGSVTHLGRIFFGGGAGGSDLGFFITSGADAVFGGLISIGRGVDVPARLEGCRLEFSPRGRLRNFSSQDNMLTGRESVSLLSTSSLRASGSNRLVYGDSLTPPTLLGSLRPAATLTLDPMLLPCPLPVCGNGVTEVGETCDDGNTIGGDGCSSSCHDDLL